MNRQGDWNVWNQRLSTLWAESLAGVQLEGDDGHPPVLCIDGINLPLAPSHWGFGEPSDDMSRIEEALGAMVQGHAPDYWRSSSDPLVQALGWLDRRIGKRSWKQHDELHGVMGRSPLEQQIRALRDHADARLELPHKTPRP